MTPPVAPSPARPLSARASELLAQRAAVGVSGGVPRRPDRSRARLSPSQQRIWLHDQLEGGAGYIRPVALRLAGALDVPALERALGTIIRRHEALHSRLETGDDGLPLLRIVADATPSLGVEDLGEPVGTSHGSAVHPRILAEAYRPFDLLNEPPVRVHLFREAPDAHLLLTVFHHVAFDGWSVAVYLKELAAAYADARAGSPDGLGELAIQCGDLVESAAASDPAPEDDIAYWRSALSGVEPVLTLPFDRPRRPHQQRDAERVPLDLPAELVERLRELSRREGVTLFMTFAAALQVLLSRYSGQEDFLIGIPVAGRTRPEMNALIGCFINTLALRCDLTGAPPFRDLMQRVRRAATGAFAHQGLPFEQVVRLLDGPYDRQLAGGVQVLLNFRNLPGAAPSLEGLAVEQVEIPPPVTLFDLELDFTDTGSDVRGALVCPSALFDRVSAERLAGHFRVLLEAALADPACAAARLPLLTEAERRELLDVGRGRSGPPPVHACIHHLIAARAAATPDATAVSGPAGELTYAQLMARAQTVAAGLRNAGVQRGDRVGLSVDRSPDLIAAMLGVMAAGAAYVPLDPEYPDERLAFMISDASLRCILTDRASHGRLLHVAGVPLLRLDGLAAPDPAAVWPGPATEADAAYVIYTSGSTGIPKGVVIGHRALTAFAVTAIDGFAITAADRFLQFSTPNFDASIAEIFPTLAAGATVVLRDAAMAESADGFLAGCIRWGVTLAVPATAFWHELVETLAAEGKCFPPSLRLMAPGGERMLPERAALWRRVAPYAELDNAYGPTETTVHVTRYRLPPDYHESAGPVPIGSPVPTARAYILDRAGELAPLGVPGELYIGGRQLADGYLNRPELTAERFVPDPFTPGERLYRTGDLVRWRTDGNLEYLGRLDRQVKVRGFRVEIGEIESALLDSDTVLECVVEARAGEAGDQRLVAYVVPARARDTAGSLAELGAHLRRRLPGYMIPMLVPVPAIPRTPNGKLDRAALPAPTLRADGAGTFVPPRSPLEFQLVQLWERLLDIRPIGVRDDFFALGGHSLLAIRMAHELERTCGHNLPLSLLFEAATIEQVAAELIRASEPAADERRQLLNSAGTRPPLIFFHGDVLGAGLYCREVARRLGGDQPVYVVGPSRPGGPATIEAMAAAELAWIREAAGGRYRLAGFCNGGLVAYEIARQLERAGEHAELVVMIDASPRNVGLGALDWLLHATGGTPDDAGGNLARRAMTLRRTADALQRCRIFWSRRRRDRLRVAGRKGLQLLESQGQPDPGEGATIDSDTSTPELRFVSRAVNAYVPRPYGGRVHLVVSSRVTGGLAEARRWERCVGSLVVHDTPVDHQAVVTVVAPDVLHECLTRIDAGERDGGTSHHQRSGR